MPEFAYNVGSGHTVTVNEVLDRMEPITGRRIARNHAPRTGLEEGLARQWEWQRNR